MTKDIGKKLLKYTNHRTNLPQITEQIFRKSPNKSSTNHRTNLLQITENCKKVLVVRNIYINFAPKNYDNMAEYKKRISDRIFCITRGKRPDCLRRHSWQ